MLTLLTLLPLGPDRFVIEMTPVWGNGATDRGVVGSVAVGARWLGVSRLFRCEVRCWPDGQIGDVAEATGKPEHVSRDLSQAQALLACVPQVPAATWGRDELGTGEMWNSNSNSLVAWLLARSGHDMATVVPPAEGRAPGWNAGLELAVRDSQPIAAVDLCDLSGPRRPRASAGAQFFHQRVLARSSSKRRYLASIWAP